MIRKFSAIFLLILAPVVLLGCGSGNGSESEGSTSSARAKKPELPLLDDRGHDAHVRMAADPGGEMRFNLAYSTASAGRVTMQFVNPQNVTHDLVIENSNGKNVARTKRVKTGAASTTVRLAPGVYHLYCSLPGHRKAGMQGRLIVDPYP